MEKTEKLLSIIIPMYNSEKYIERCLKSIIDGNSNMNLIEIILIDDGSTDNTYNICKKYLSNDLYIYLYHQDNKGVSTARNKGIEKCNGKYIFFIDADDFLVENWSDSLINKINNNSDLELLLMDYFIINNNKNERIRIDNKSSMDMLYKNIVYQRNNALWNKIFLRRIICDNNIKFDSRMKTSEDGYFILEYSKHINTVIVSNEAIYNYERNDNGAVNNVKLSYISDFLKLNEEINNFCKEKCEILINNSNNITIERIYYIIYKYLNKNKNIDDLKNIINNNISKFKMLNKNIKEEILIKYHINKKSINYLRVFHRWMLLYQENMVAQAVALTSQSSLLR